MSDALQFAIVTIAAAAAGAMLIRSYVRAASRKAATPCANCGLTKPAAQAAQAVRPVQRASR
jgi:hypothetical protein